MFPSTPWSAQQYVKFEDERTRPVRDLLNAVPLGKAHCVIDVGCGPGNSTELLRARFPEAMVSGIDSSPDMIEAARLRLPDVAFEVADASTWQGTGRYDVILANAVFQWLPDHEHLFPRLLGRLTPGGALAVQMPDNLDEPAHTLLRDVAAQAPWTERLRGAERSVRHSADWYYALLSAHGAKVDVWRTTYHHPLPGGIDAVVEWFKGSALRPVLSRLDAEEGEVFLARYRAALDAAYPTLPDGTVLLPFPRLFVVATAG